MTRTWLVRTPVVVTLAFAFGLASCANDGRDLAEPHDWQTTTTRPAPPTSAPPQDISDSGLAISSPDFEPGDYAPMDTQCAGANVFPSLAIDGVPSDIVELGVTLADQTDPENPVLLWLMAGIDPDRDLLDSGILPTGAYETLNDYGQHGWGNPCLEGLASGLRDLQFRIYGLTAPADISSGDPGNEAWDTLTASAVDSATLLMQIEGTG